MDQALYFHKNMVAFARKLGGTGNSKRQPHFSKYGMDGRYVFNQIVKFPEFENLTMRFRLSLSKKDDGPIFEVDLVDANLRSNQVGFSQLSRQGEVLKIQLECVGNDVSIIMKFEANIQSIVRGYKGQGRADDDFKRIHGYFDTSRIRANTDVNYVLHYTVEPPKIRGLGFLGQIYGEPGPSQSVASSNSTLTVEPELNPRNVVAALVDSNRVDPTRFEEASRFIRRCRRDSQPVDRTPYEKLNWTKKLEVLEDAISPEERLQILESKFFP